MEANQIQILLLYARVQQCNNLRNIVYVSKGSPHRALSGGDFLLSSASYLGVLILYMPHTLSNLHPMLGNINYISPSDIPIAQEVWW